MTTRPLPYDVEPAPPAPWRLGVFRNGTGFNRFDDAALRRLGQGIAYEALDNAIADDPGFDPCAEDISISSDEYDQDDIAQWEAWGLAFAKSCSILTGDADALAARARAVADARSSYWGERIAWTGSINAGDTFAGQGWANRPIASAAAANLTTTLNGSAAVGLVYAFGQLYEYLADTLDGTRGVIHVPPVVIPYLGFYGLAVRDTFTVGTALGDHLIAAGSGYQGTSPAGADAAAGTAWIYATSMIRVGQTPIETRIDYDRDEDKMTATAYRTQILEWDLQAHAAVLVCLPDPGPECP